MDDYFRVRKGLSVANSTATANLSPDTLTIGALTANALLVNTAAINIIGRANTATFFATTSANVGANVQLSTTGIAIGNTTANVWANSIMLQVANSTATANLNPNSLTIGTTVVNTIAIAAANVIVTGSISANGGLGTAGQVLTSNATVAYWSNAYTIANTSQYLTATSNTILLTPLTIWNSAKQQVLVDNTTIVINCSNGFNFGNGSGSGVLLAGNRGLGNPTGGVEGMGIQMWFKASTSTRTLASNTSYDVHLSLESFPISIATTDEVCITGVFTNSTYVRITSIMRF